MWIKFFIPIVFNQFNNLQTHKIQLHGKGVKTVAEKLEPAHKYSLKIEVDYADVDTAIEKVNRLVELLREASSIIDSLSAGKNLEA